MKSFWAVFVVTELLDPRLSIERICIDENGSPLLFRTKAMATQKATETKRLYRQAGKMKFMEGDLVRVANVTVKKVDIVFSN